MYWFSAKNNHIQQEKVLISITVCIFGRWKNAEELSVPQYNIKQTSDENKENVN